MNKILLLLFITITISSEAVAFIIRVPDNFQTIQEAVDHAGNSDTVEVASGTYYENIVINKRIVLMGTDSSNTEINGNFSGHCIEIRADFVVVEGFKIKHSLLEDDGSGIVFMFCDSSKVRKCAILDNQNGITFYKTRGNLVEYCNIRNNLNGICLDEYIRSDTAIMGDNRYNKIINNSINNNDIGFNFKHILSHHLNNLISRNLIDHNNKGIDIIMSYASEFSYNYITNNMNYGILTSICEGGGGGNIFHHNFIMGNNVKFKQVNICNSDALYSNGEGNYWDDFIGIDRDYDGIADQPFKLDFLDHGVIDYFPLMEIRDKGPGLIYPLNKSNPTEANIVFKWEELDDAVGYKLEVSKDFDFQNDDIIISNNYSNGMSDTIRLEKGKKYYWRVREIRYENINNWSYVRIFSTGMDSPLLIYPENSAYSLDSNTTLWWQSIGDIEKYTVQISNNSYFNQLVVNDSLITSDSINPCCLDYNSKYYWRVRAKNKYSLSYWSETWVFRTKTIPPVLISPRNDTTNTNFSIKLNWKQYNDIQSYIIQFSSKFDFSEVLTCDTIQNNYYNVSQLDFYTDYFWRVKINRSTEESGWSEIRHFKTKKYAGNTSIPLLKTPNNLTVNMKIPFNFSWDASNKGKYYYLQIAKDSLFKNIYFEDDSLPNLNYTLTNLEKSTVYYWRVKSVKGSEITPWSEIWNFTTSDELISTPILYNPQGENPKTAVNVNFQWFGVNGATGYYLQLSENDNFEELLVDDSTLTNTYYTINNLKYNVKYCLRLKAKYYGNESKWSETRYFTTTEYLLDPPTLLYPPASTSITEVNFMFQWNIIHNASKYHLQVSRNENFDDLIVDDSTITKLYYQITGLDYNKKYYWRMKSKFNNYESNWSLIRNFVTKYFTLDLPNIVYPSPSGYAETDSCFYIVWDLVNSAKRYHIQFGEKLIQDLIINDSTIEDDQYFICGLKYDTYYYWRIRAFNDTLTSGWSMIYRIFTKKPVSVNDYSEINMTSIYTSPNPFSESVEIQYYLEKSEFITIKIYDILGQVVKDFGNNFMIEGEHTINWTPSNIPQGIHYVIITGDGWQKTNKLIYME